MPVSALDNLFISASAVSTTGLVSVDPGSSYSFWGQLVILGLIQLGGLGYLTLGSFIVLSLTKQGEPPWLYVQGDRPDHLCLSALWHRAVLRD